MFTVAEPLYNLYRKVKHGPGLKRAMMCFSPPKNCLQAPVCFLTYYDAHKPICLLRDAFAYWLGAVIFTWHLKVTNGLWHSHRERLPSAKINYAPGERETFTHFWIEKSSADFRTGANLWCTEAISHGLPGIFGYDTPVPTLAAARMQRWALITSAYSYSLKPQKG